MFRRSFLVKKKKNCIERQLCKNIIPYNYYENSYQFSNANFIIVILFLIFKLFKKKLHHFFDFDVIHNINVMSRAEIYQI